MAAVSESSIREADCETLINRSDQESFTDIVKSNSPRRKIAVLM